jgi:hypothetical protein
MRYTPFANGETIAKGKPKEPGVRLARSMRTSVIGWE